MLSKSLTAAALGALLIAAPAANAAVTVVSGPTPGSTTATFTPAPGTNTAVLNFNGFSGNGGPTIPNLTAQLSLSLLGVAGNSYKFGYVLTNTSSAPISSRISIFGFNANPNFASVSNITGAFGMLSSGNQPNGLPNLEFCLRTGNGGQCSGGGGGGLTNSQSANGGFWLNFNSPQTSLALSDFSVRYQSVAGAGNVTSASGVPFGLVPEPATWAMMILGFGLIGGALRSRKATTATRVTYA